MTDWAPPQEFPPVAAAWIDEEYWAVTSITAQHGAFVVMLHHPGPVTLHHDSMVRLHGIDGSFILRSTYRGDTIHATRDETINVGWRLEIDDKRAKDSP